MTTETQSSITVSFDPSGAERITIRGELSRDNIRALVDPVESAIAAGEHAIILDFAESPYADGWAIEALGHLAGRRLETNMPMLVCEHLNRDQFAVFRAVGLDRVLLIREDAAVTP